ncbi:glycosyltransferase family 2 protein [Agromyces sp. NPDC056523]|uniref:glycosyltransferase family 2 protein n=1 Tax=Agromyces sp. NPDC056523 TaxID=3345850 RepID=UPI00366F1EF0
MPEYDVDLVIAVHDPKRQIERAVGSALSGTRSPIRVTVVSHNTDAMAVRARLAAFADDARLRFLDLTDGIRSPSGPFNLGLEAATAEFVSIMGSDDELEPGAIDSWLALARRSRAELVLPSLRIAGGPRVPTPPARPLRRTGLDGVRDRLAYRSAPLGLVSRARFGAMRFPAGFAAGEDIEYVTALWYSGARIAFDRRGPAYLIHSDAPSRASTSVRPLATDAAILDSLFTSPQFRALGPRERDSVVVKLYRVNVLGWVANRPLESQWRDEDRQELVTAIERCRRAAPRAERLLSRLDRQVIELACMPGASTRALLDAASARRSRARPGALLPRRLRDAIRSEAPLRFTIASALVRFGA